MMRQAICTLFSYSDDMKRDVSIAKTKLEELLNEIKKKPLISNEDLYLKGIKNRALLCRELAETHIMAFWAQKDINELHAAKRHYEEASELLQFCMHHQSTPIMLELSMKMLNEQIKYLESEQGAEYLGLLAESSRKISLELLERSSGKEAPTKKSLFRLLDSDINFNVNMSDEKMDTDEDSIDYSEKTHRDKIIKTKTPEIDNPFELSSWVPYSLGSDL